MTVLLNRTSCSRQEAFQPGLEREIEVVIDGQGVTFLWNDPEIQQIAEELGEPIFKKPRPCG